MRSGSLAAHKVGGPFHADAARSREHPPPSVQRKTSDSITGSARPTAPHGGSLVARSSGARRCSDASAACSVRTRERERLTSNQPQSPIRPASARRVRERVAYSPSRRSSSRPSGRAASEAGYPTSSRQAERYARARTQAKLPQHLASTTPQPLPPALIPPLPACPGIPTWKEVSQMPPLKRSPRLGL